MRTENATYVHGFAEAEKQFYEITHSGAIKEFINPFAQGTEEHRGFEEGVYTFTQK